MSATLLIPVGIPGCGKSTWAKRLFDLKYSIVSTDAIRKDIFGSLTAAHAGEDPEIKAANNARVFDTFHARIHECLRHSVDVVADATNLTAGSRETLRGLAADTKAKTHLVLFANPTQAIERNRERPDDTRVGKDIMRTFLDKYYVALNDIPQEEYDFVTEIRSVR